ncbi:unnamed protein product [Nippostrongylus brasiliensis]|uniref:Uncharacterized protein n=1 Tax=Nippostrongylus brasiliensis TaxID=27835 RepID=A0A0N4XSR9_NIPBR|nr:unnamed protein product [Nippostrongylus brasiliensis]
MFTISTLHDVDEFRTICPQPKVLKLSSSTSGVLPAGGLKAHQFYSFVNAPEIHMCIRIEYSSLRTLDLSNIKRIIPTCRGKGRFVYFNCYFISIFYLFIYLFIFLSYSLIYLYLLFIYLFIHSITLTHWRQYDPPVGRTLSAVWDNTTHRWVVLFRSVVVSDF